MRVPSTDHVDVAVHDLGGSGRPLLLSHATGFHGHCYVPIAGALADGFASWAIDYRGHGDTPRPPDWPVDWERYGDDALAVAEALAPDGGLVGFGHSMGGAALLMAADRTPTLFDLIVAFEPIVFPAGGNPASDEPSRLIEGARRRRATFPSFEDAVDNYGSKPPMNAFDPDVLRLYVEHGFRPDPDGIRLACEPEHEARTFEQGSRHDTWGRLPGIETRVVVVGSGDGEGPASVAPAIAERLPNAAFVAASAMTHFGPFTHPLDVADLIAEHA